MTENELPPGKPEARRVFQFKLFLLRRPHRSRHFDGRVIPNPLTLFGFCPANPCNEEASAMSSSKKNANPRRDIRAAVAGHRIVIWMDARPPLPRARPFQASALGWP